MTFPKLALFAALLSPVLFSPAYAQRGGGHGGGGGHASGGGGHSSGAVRGGSSGSFRGGGDFRGGDFRGGYYGGRYYGPSFYFGVGGYPYYGYYGYDPYYYGYGPYAYGGYPAYAPPPAPVQPNSDYGYRYPEQGQPAPAQPQQQPPQTQPQSTNGNDPGQNFYLIAFTDHSIQAATAYKVEGDQIRWITREGEERGAPLSKVDIQFSEQINHDRQVDFQIP